MSPLPAPAPGAHAPLGSVGPGAATWHEALRAFKRRLLEHALASTAGNRTHAARALGLPRTYLLRLINDLGVAAPPAAGATHRRAGADTSAPVSERGGLSLTEPPASRGPR